MWTFSAHTPFQFFILLEKSFPTVYNMPMFGKLEKITFQGVGRNWGYNYGAPGTGSNDIFFS